MKGKPTVFGVKSLKIGKYVPETGLYAEVDYPASVIGVDLAYPKSQFTVIQVVDVPAFSVVSVTRLPAHEFRRFQRILLPAWYRQIMRRCHRNGKWRKRR